MLQWMATDLSRTSRVLYRAPKFCTLHSRPSSDYHVYCLLAGSCTSVLVSCDAIGFSCTHKGGSNSVDLPGTSSSPATPPSYNQCTLPPSRPEALSSWIVHRQLLGFLRKVNLFVYPQTFANVLTVANVNLLTLTFVNVNVMPQGKLSN